MNISKQIKIYQCLEQIQNDLYSHVYTYEDFDFAKVEEIVLRNLLLQFNNTEIERLTGISIRTIRNKKHLYGLFPVSKDHLVLLKEARKESARPAPRGCGPVCGDEGGGE
jgi:hypothetical protein